MRKALTIAVLGAFTVALVAKTVLFGLGKVTGAGDIIELCVSWGVVLAVFVASVVKMVFPAAPRWVAREEDEDTGEDPEEETEETNEEETDEETEEDVIREE